MIKLAEPKDPYSSLAISHEEWRTLPSVQATKEALEEELLYSDEMTLTLFPDITYRSSVLVAEVVVDQNRFQITRYLADWEKCRAVARFPELETVDLQVSLDMLWFQSQKVLDL